MLALPCNPSIGGSAKGLSCVKVDALGGEMAKTIDKSYIQMKMLNTGKGPVVRALRAQARNFTLRKCARRLKIKKI